MFADEVLAAYELAFGLQLLRVIRLAKQTARSKVQAGMPISLEIAPPESAFLADIHARAMRGELGPDAKPTSGGGMEATVEDWAREGSPMRADGAALDIVT